VAGRARPGVKDLECTLRSLNFIMKAAKKHRQTLSCTDLGHDF
jgi:hypothetical protein